MDFSKFSHIFIKFLECTSGTITQELVDAIGGKRIENEIDISGDGWSKYHTGSSKFKKIANKIKYSYKKENFIGFLDDNIDDEAKPKLINEFKKVGYMINSDKWKEEITDIFVRIIDEANGIYTEEKINVKDEIKELNNKIIESYSKDFNEADKSIKEAFNKSFGVVNMVQSSNLDPELQKYYNIEYNHINGKTFGTLVPKNKEALIKYPYNILIMPEDDTNDERIRLNKSIQKIQKEANINNELVPVNESLKMVERLGNYESPIPILKDKISLFIGPNPNVRSSYFTIRLYNKHYEFRLENIKMWLLYNDKDNFIFSNIRNKSSDFVFKIEVSNNNNKPTTKCYFRTKEEYLDDAQANKRNYLWRILTADSRANLQIKSDLVDKDISKSINVGKTKFTNKDYQEFKNVISYFDKIIFLEQYFNTHIDVKQMDMYQEIPAIDFLYYSIKKRSKTFKRTIYFDLEVKKEYLNDFIEGTTLANIKTDMHYVQLRGITYDLYNTKIEMDKAEIIKVNKLNNDYYKVYFQTDKVKMIVD